MEGVYMFAGEVFPTDVRGTGLGMCNVCARIGGILAPQVDPNPNSTLTLHRMRARRLAL